MMQLIVDRMAEILTGSADPVTPAGSAGARVPDNGSQIPAVVISLSIDSTRGTGFGRFIRSGNVLAEHTAAVQVARNPDTFPDDLTHLRVAPLPLRRNPDSSSEDFGAEDIQVSNVTDPVHPIDYRFVDPPHAREEYRIDEEQAEIVFGAPQTEGDTLQVTHWTVTWRDDIVGERYSGLISLEVWSARADQATTMSKNLQDRLLQGNGDLREKGFMKLQPAALEPLETVQYAPPTGSPLQVWKQRMSYRFAFEAEEGGEISDGLPIKRIDVDIKHPRETFSVP